MARGRLEKLFNSNVPLYFLFSSSLLVIMVAIGLGWIALRAEREGVEKVPFGEAAQAIFDAPNLFFSVPQTINTQIKGLNLEIKGDYVPPNPEQFVALESVDPMLDMAGPLLMGADTALPGWRVLVGYFQVDGTMISAAVLLNASMRVEHVWPLHERDIEHKHKRGPLFKFPHGLEILPDGSIIYAFDWGISLKRVSWCGETMWSRKGFYHHSVTLSEDRATVWTLRHQMTNDKARSFDVPENRFVEQVDAVTGELLLSFSIEDLIAANPEISAMHTRTRPRIYKQQVKWERDPFHENDVDPLPPSLADQFPQFEVDDLLLSLRNVNLVMVVDPDSLKIKWWRVEAVSRQHDPDWLEGGNFSIFDNNPQGPHSRIIEIDPQSYAVTTTVDGSELGFTTEGRGKHQILPNDSIVVTSAAQGRAFEITRSGEVVFEFVNSLAETPEKTLFISELRWLPQDYFDGADFPECPAPAER